MQNLSKFVGSTWITLLTQSQPRAQQLPSLLCFDENTITIIIIECSAQRQVFHCKWRNLGCSSAEGRSSTANSGIKAAVLLGI